MEQDENYKPLITLVIVLLLFYCSSLFAIIPIKLFNIDTNTCSDLVLYSTRLFANFVTAIFLFIIYYKDLKKDVKDLKKNFKSIFSIAIKCWIFGFIAMLLSSYLISKYSPVSMPSNELSVREVINTTPIIAFLMTSLLAPFIEEIIFRKSFKDVFKSFFLYLFISAFVFGSLHVIGNIKSLYELLYIIPYTSLGLSFAYCYYKTNNIFSSIFIHFLHNTIGIILIIVGTMGW